MKIGSIVRLKSECLDNPVGSIGVCYEEYSEEGRSFIFQNGNYDGFSKEDQRHFLSEIGFSPKASTYTFRNVLELSRDFKNGFFDDSLVEWNLL